jgi:predicted DCC family thiol-disulfide oxidoreductase YuxK
MVIAISVTNLFSALSSDMGMSLLEKAGLDRNQINSVVFFSNGKYFLKSLAILKLLRLLGGGWQLFYIFIIIPAFIRDFLYDIIARNRYRIFGTSKTCMIPDTETENRFLL